MEENIRTAVVIFFFVLTTVFTATVLLISVTGSPLLDCTYEIISAVATVQNHISFPYNIEKKWQSQSQKETAAAYALLPVPR